MNLFEFLYEFLSNLIAFVLFHLIIIIYMPVLLSEERQKYCGCRLVEGDQKDLGGARREKTLVRIYFMKKANFNQ